ncbi:glycosyltransferase [Paenibacillus naphthalenovorans]|uniref:glycosyltransferase n=1 Tax=Paenibacillus naphthalenovorans TaxID=162209 RepID=UPI0010BC246E|nr:glycosyltransferase [Paenibacillus naphthalenovorans]GCL72380.1 hypothetical protein PN4B1_22900 [Paenibacillus naphthalenovorans]
MRILHAPQNIAGMAGLMAKKQRDMGYLSESFVTTDSIFKYPADYSIKSTSTLGRRTERFQFFAKSIKNYDIFHFYFGESLLGQQFWDVPLLKKLNKKVFFYFAGCDIRDSKKVITTYEFSACKECWPMLCSPNRKKSLEIIHQANGVFVSTPDLLEFVENSVLLQQPIDVAEFNLLKEQVNLNKTTEIINDTIKIAHAPTSRALKGTGYLIDAVERLKAEGYKIELIMVEGRPYKEAIQLYNEADIAVDQLLIGAYGQFAVEMMALGKPVICYIREDLIDKYPENLPIISSTKNNIVDVLRNTIKNRDKWASIGLQGESFVKMNHDAAVIAAKAIEYYKTL